MSNLSNIKIELNSYYFIIAILIIIFTASILGSALFLFSGDRFKPGLNHSVLKFEKYVVYLATLVVFVNVVAAFFECQFGPCCENGPCV